MVCESQRVSAFKSTFSVSSSQRSLPFGFVKVNALTSLQQNTIGTHSGSVCSPVTQLQPHPNAVLRHVSLRLLHFQRHSHIAAWRKLSSSPGERAAGALERNSIRSRAFELSLIFHEPKLNSTRCLQVEVIGSILTLKNFPAPPSLSSNATSANQVIFIDMLCPTKRITLKRSSAFARRC